MEKDEIIESPDTQRDIRIPPGQSETDGLPVLHEGPVPDIKPEDWAFAIRGLVDNEKLLSFDEFTSLPMVKVHADIHCVTGWSRLDTLWEGVSAKEIVQAIKIDERARFVVIQAWGGYETNLPIDDFLQDDVLFALKLDGKPIPPEHGYPVRLVVPKLYFWKSPKWVTGIEFLENDRRGFWENRGYHNHGDPWTEERYSHQE